ncbi:hypothetical protein KNE206_67990 [Kitasatospora sp. NE20-6]
MGPIPQEQWEQIYTDGIAFSPLGEDERQLLAEHAPAPAGGGRALEVGCGRGELAVHLAAAGYRVDAVDLAEAALERARTEYPGATGVRWLRLDIEHDDPEALGDELYDLVVFRLALAFIGDRARVLHAVGRRLREGGTLLIITPLAATTPADRRHIAVDEQEKRDQATNRKKKGSRGGRPVGHDAGLYKDRNTVERLINRLKAWRGIATRFDKTPESYLAGLHLRAAMIWIKDLTKTTP